MTSENSKRSAPSKSTDGKVYPIYNESCEVEVTRDGITTPYKSEWITFYRGDGFVFLAHLLKHDGFKVPTFKLCLRDMYVGDYELTESLEGDFKVAYLGEVFHGEEPKGVIGKGTLKITQFSDVAGSEHLGGILNFIINDGREIKHVFVKFFLEFSLPYSSRSDESNRTNKST